jgi:hypothetical protein
MYPVAISGTARKEKRGVIESQMHEGPVRQCPYNEFMPEKGPVNAQGK